MNLSRILSAVVILLAQFSSFATELGYTVSIDRESLPDANTAHLLYTKLEKAITDASFPASGDNALFLTAKLIPVSENLIEGGMRKIQQCTYELQLEVENPILGVKFGTTSLTLKGHGTDRIKTVTDAIRNIAPSGSSLGTFLKSTNEKAETYYTQHFDDIISKAKTIASAGSYEEAIALLWGMPPIGPKSQLLYSSINDIYTTMQLKECGRLIQYARSAIAVRNYEEAAEWLRAVSVTSPCNEEAQKLITLVKEGYAEERELAQRREDAERARQDRMIENERRRQHSLEKAKINAISSIATAYLNSRRQNVYYVF